MFSIDPYALPEGIPDIVGDGDRGNACVTRSDCSSCLTSLTPPMPWSIQVISLTDRFDSPRSSVGALTYESSVFEFLLVFGVELLFLLCFRCSFLRRFCRLVSEDCNAADGGFGGASSTVKDAKQNARTDVKLIS